MSIVAPLVLGAVAFAIPPSASPPSASEVASEVMADFQMEMDVKLLDAGAKPRRVLRYQPKPGSSVDLEMVNRQSMKMEMIGPDGKPIPLPGMGDMSPTSIIGMHQEVEQPVQSGLVPVQIRYTTATVEGVPPEVQQMMLAGMKGLEGLSFRMLVDPKTGKVEQVDVGSTESGELYEGLQSMMDGFVRNLAQFPAEPVGPGATWTIGMDMSFGGMELDATNEVTLTKVQGDRVEMSFNMVMKRGDGPFEMPGLPPGATVDFTRFDAKGSGTYVVDLGSMASFSSSTTSIQMGVEVTGEGQSMTMNMSMVQESELRPKR